MRPIPHDNTSRDITSKSTITVSISGHRDCVNPDKIKAKLKERLDEIKEGYLKKKKSRESKPDIDPDTVGRWIFLSPLATGADQIGAEVALECGFELIVPFPMPSDLYREDFSDEEWSKLEGIKSQVVQVVELDPLTCCKKISVKANGGSYTPERNEQYAAVGAFVYHYSDIMLFLWDGKEEQAVGGTCFVKKYALTGDGINCNLPFHDSCLQFHPKKILWHLPVNRSKYPSASQKSDDLVWQELKGTDGSGRIIDDWIRLSQIFQKQMGSVADAQIQESKRYLLGDGASPSGLEGMIEAYSCADGAAIQAQNTNDWYRDSIFVMTGLALLCFCVLTGFPLDRLGASETVPAWGYLLMLLMATGFFAFTRGWLDHGRNLQKRAHGLRTLAEGLRVQIFLSASGLRDFVGDFYSGKAPQELGWVLRLLRQHHLGLLSQPSACNWGFVEMRWIKDQESYFSKKSEEFAAKAKKFYWLANLLVIASVLLTVVLVILWGCGAIEDNAWLLFFIGLTPALAAYVKVWSVIHGHQRNAEEYKRMHQLFSRASELWDSSDDERKQKIVRELAREALTENSEWLYYFQKEDVKPIN